MQEKQEKPASAPVGHGRENRIICPYLDTVDRSVLDFDFEKVCSVTLSNVNVYACLVCGKYFQGRGQHTPAFEHSLEVEHHVFMHLETLKAWCLPEGYEIIDASLDDIKHVIRPLLAPEYIATLDRVSRPSRTLDGTTYLPGFVGLNNIGHTDYINAVVHALSRVTPLRNHLLLEANTEGFSPLVSRFGDLLRRMWNPSNFRPQVSPHELVQLVDVLSKRHFHIGTPGDPTEFMAWFLHCLRTDLRHPPVTARPPRARGPRGRRVVRRRAWKHGRSGAPVAKRGKRTVVEEAFEGSVKIVTHPKGHDPRKLRPEAAETTSSPFLFLSLDIPAAPLFQEKEKQIIPQIPLPTLMSKFDGTNLKIQYSGEGKQYQISQLPPYLMLHFNRFTKSNFISEKNPTIVNFFLKNLDMTDYTVGHIPARYDLVANICHDGTATDGVFKVYLLNKAKDAWYLIHDLNVEEVFPDAVRFSQTCLQIYERQPDIAAIPTPSPPSTGPTDGLPTLGATSTSTSTTSPTGSVSVTGSNPMPPPLVEKPKGPAFFQSSDVRR